MGCNSWGRVRTGPRLTSSQRLPSARFPSQLSGSMIWSYFWLSYLLTWALIPHILLRNKPPVSALAWIWAVILFPYIGPLFYFVFGTERIERKKLRANLEMAASGARDERKITARTRALLEALPVEERVAM